jgi:transcriptional regulator with XRE-family HTH domain
VAKKFSELRERMSPAAKQRSEREFRRMIEEMPLNKLRNARNLTQQNLAKALNVNQSEISKIESRADVYVSTLASYVEAMGGKLEIRAVFRDGATVMINQFEDLAKTDAEASEDRR